MIVWIIILLFPDIDTGIAKKALEAENEQLQHQLLRLQSQLDVVEAEKQSLRGAQQESIAFGIQPWKVPRENVEIERIIGGGGWGVVSKGKLQVAVKQFHPNILSAQNLSRLKREMRMLALVRHPNLLQFIAVVFDDDDHDYEQNPPYIITELLDMSLRSAYEKEKLQNSDLIPIFYDTAKALDYLHCRHEPIIHRDVSSANILLKKQHNGKWIAKLSDLGSANLANKAYTLNEGARVYCAPEAFTFDSNARSVISLTPKIDVYSYGIMLCEVATKTFPDDTALPAMQIRIQHERPQLYHLIVACTRYSADQRPTMEEVLKLLETFQ